MGEGWADADADTEPDTDTDTDTEPDAEGAWSVMGVGNLGHEIAHATIQAILKEHGLEPAPERSKRTTWKSFLCAHWDAIVTCDFFTVEVLTLAGLTRYHVLFVIALATRRVEIVASPASPMVPGWCSWPGISSMWRAASSRASAIYSSIATP